MTEHECSRNAKGVNSSYSLPEWLAGMWVGGRVLPCQQGSPPPRTWPFLFQIIIANIP